jgi:hypothetical protein
MKKLQNYNRFYIQFKTKISNKKGSTDKDKTFHRTTKLL